MGRKANLKLDQALDAERDLTPNLVLSKIAAEPRLNKVNTSKSLSQGEMKLLIQNI